jgi:hypothetical protein
MNFHFAPIVPSSPFADVAAQFVRNTIPNVHVLYSLRTGIINLLNCPYVLDKRGCVASASFKNMADRGLVPAVPTGNIDPNVLMMQPAQHGQRGDIADRLRAPEVGRVLVQ